MTSGIHSHAGAKLQVACGSVGSPSDSLAERYRLLAQDESVDSQLREAASTFCVAEELLNDEESFEEAVTVGKKAMQLFKDANHEQAVSDAVRLVIHGYRAKAQLLQYDNNKEAAEEVLAKAQELASDELERFKSLGERRGEGALLLALAEVNVEKRERRGVKAKNNKDEEIIEAGLQALTVFKDLQDSSMQGNTMMILAAEYLKHERMQDGRKMANDAVDLFRQTGDQMQLAKALHISAASKMAGDWDMRRFEEAIEASKESANIFNQLGKPARKLEAYQYLRIAKWCTVMERPKEGLPYARKALAMFKEMNYGKGWQANALSSVTACLVMLNDVKEAMRLVKQEVDFFRQASDKRTLILGLEELTGVLLEGIARGLVSDFKEALVATEEALSLARTLEDKSWEAHLLHWLGQVHFRSGEKDLAIERVNDACKMFIALGNKDEQCVAMQSMIDMFICEREVDKATELAEQLRSLRKENSEAMMESGALLMMASLKMMKGNWQDALGMVTEAQAMLQKEGDKRTEASAWALMSEVHKMSGNWDAAVRAAKTMEELQSKTFDKRTQAEGAKHLASLYHPQFPEQALHAATKALTLYRASAHRCLEEVDMLMLVSSCQMALAAALGEEVKNGAVSDAKMQKMAEKFKSYDDKALRPAKEAVALSRRLSCREVLGHALFQVGQVHLMYRRFEEVREVNDEAAAIFRETGDQHGEGSTFLQMAEMNFLEGDTQAGYAAADQARSIFETGGNQQMVDKVAEVLDHFQRRGGHAGAARPQAPGIASSMPAAPEEVKQAMDVEVARQMIVDVAMNCIGDETSIELDAPLMDIGLDSLAAVEFREQLQQKSGFSLPASLMFDYPCVHAISQHLVEISGM